MDLSHRPSVVAVLASTLAVIVAQAPPPLGPYTGDRCEGYNGVEGTCTTIDTCATLQEDVNLLPVPELVARHGPSCDYDLRGHKLVCCPRNSTEGASAGAGAGAGAVSGCEMEGVVYPDGHVTLDECFPVQCVNGSTTTIIHHTIGNECVPPFESYEGYCFHYNTSRKTWCQARHRCWDMQAELAISAPERSNYKALKAFNLLKHQSGFGAWVGLRNKKWLNGSEAEKYQWRFGEPDTEDECGFMGSGGLRDYACHKILPYICQLF